MRSDSLAAQGASSRVIEKEAELRLSEVQP
jgi:hypothetical protein